MANPSFEDWDGANIPTDWLIFPVDLGNWGVVATGDGMYPDDTPFTAQDGTNSLKLYGQFTGWASETPVYQEFAVTEGQVHTIEGYMYMYANDAFDGNQTHASLWLKYFDDSYTFFEMVESAKFDATATTDVWTMATATGTAPAGATKVQAGVSFFHCQDEAEGDCYEGGGVYFDNLNLYEVTE